METSFPFSFDDKIHDINITRAGAAERFQSRVGSIFQPR